MEQQLRSAARSVLMLDYDGTLAPFHINRFEATPIPPRRGRLASVLEFDAQLDSRYRPAHRGRFRALFFRMEEGRDARLRRAVELEEDVAEEVSRAHARLRAQHAAARDDAAQRAAIPAPAGSSAVAGSARS